MPNIIDIFNKKQSLLFGILVALLFSYSCSLAPLNRTPANEGQTFSSLATFGAEFTFTNRDIIRESSISYDQVRPIRKKAKDDLIATILKSCDGCYLDKNFIYYPNGIWIDVSLDPSVVEVRMKPVTVEEFEHFAPTLQKDLFENAKNLGLLPDPEYGGGHIHIGLESAFENDDLLFRNFMVDFFNHPEIASGIWKEDLLNAPHLTKLPNEKINRFIELVETFDNGKLNLWDLLWAITNEVYDVNLAPKSWSEDASPDKYQAFNIRRIVGSFAKEEKTAEIRCSKAQNDAFEFLAQIKLLQNRINYLRQLGHPIRPVILKNLSPQQKVDNYFDYITESGGNWRMYKELLHSEYKHLTPEHARNGTLWKNEMLKKLAQTNIEWTEIYRELKGVDIISEDVLEVTTIALKNAKIETIEYQELSTIFNYGHWKNDSLGKNIVNMTEKKLENYNAFPRKIIRSCLGALMNLIWPVSK